MDNFQLRTKQGVRSDSRTVV